MSYTLSSNDITRLVTISSSGTSIDVDYPMDITSYNDLSDNDWTILLSPFISMLPTNDVTITADIQPNTGVQGDLLTISWTCSNTSSINISGTPFNDGVYANNGNLSFKQYDTGNLSIIVTNNDTSEQMSVYYNIEFNKNVVRVDPTQLLTSDNPYGIRLE